MRNHAELVIIGGGILGTSAAYHLAEKGMTDIVLVEARSLGSGSTTQSAAMVLHQAGEKTKIELAKKSIAIIEQRVDSIKELGIDIGYRKKGSILYTSAESKGPLLESLASFQNGKGIRSQMLNEVEVRELIPWAELRDVRFAVYCAEDGVVDAPKLTRGFAMLAKERGVDIQEDVEATNILSRGRKITGVSTSRGTIHTPMVLNAAGMRASEVGNWLGLTLPLINNRRDLMVIKPQFHLPSFPIIEDIATEWYIRPFESNAMLVGKGSVVPVKGDPREVNLDAIDAETDNAFRQYLRYRAPLAADGKRMAAWGGIRTFNTCDQAEIVLMGKYDDCQVEGYFNLCGAGAFGVTLGPIYGSMVADAIIIHRTDVADTRAKFW